MKRSATQVGGRFVVDNMHLVEDVETLFDETSNGFLTTDNFEAESTDFALFGIRS